MNYAFVCILALLLSGCATQQSVLSPYTALPEDCAGLTAEMLALGEADALANNVNFVAMQIPTAAAAAAGAGLVPVGWAWAPTVATAISYYRQGTHEQRISVLHYRRERLGCPTLQVIKKTAGAEP